jgi:anthranilate phosphoribosyltransferase
VVFRGEGGEIERRPNKPTQVWTTHGDGEPLVETWPAILDDAHQPADEAMAPERLFDLWSGTDQDAYALASVVGTLAVTLRTMGRADSMEEASALAQRLWDARDRSFLKRG